MEIEFHPEAEYEFIEASERYESRVSGLGSRKFPFSLIYSVEGSLIWIIAVAHQSRRPGYWRKRK